MVVDTKAVVAPTAPLSSFGSSRDPAGSRILGVAARTTPASTGDGVPPEAAHDAIDDLARLTLKGTPLKGFRRFELGALSG